MGRFEQGMEIKDDQLDSEPVRSMLSFQIDKTKEREAQECKREILVKPTPSNIDNIQANISAKHKACSFGSLHALPIRPIFKPERARARRADGAPGPGVFALFPPVARSLICKAVIPSC
jgi:hypothetical protein